ncbi:hypothetical protein COX24_00745 [bacterium (Candidatus Gribaldobacteria) CG23_combo_of_CG06-09_8_20_14_all_37_87_8]|uniref:Uncharacterized protein n=2 Tax=Candidatus Gribaldobacteria TaxID=2798536 RepID=A0A2G9ZFL5_9BACT|nr:MAG: hypothetical protein COX24_00745 [bacterium (Candidatus Gribaldobacteria) CG23_combo_of_CG06-09_8_20_14_all_37_87_8]PIR89866.1 MAG: hypothetical protein COU05_03800 [bacterium (Candidatus Gribaldobacteria) CG10_big_fil_rev_8_21_14_0_10_37_21]
MRYSYLIFTLPLVLFLLNTFCLIATRQRVLSYNGSRADDIKGRWILMKIFFFVFLLLFLPIFFWQKILVLFIGIVVQGFWTMMIFESTFVIKEITEEE